MNNNRGKTSQIRRKRTIKNCKRLNRIYETLKRNHQLEFGWSVAGRKNLNDHLRDAIIVNNDSRVVDLLEKGAAVNNADQLQRTPLHLAVSHSYPNLVQILLDYGADPSLKDAAGNTPLHLASIYGNAAITKILITRGADVKSQDSRGLNPIQLARERFKKLASFFHTAFDEKFVYQEQIQAIVENLSASVDQSQAEEIEALTQKMAHLNPNDHITTLLDQLKTMSL